MAKIDKTISVKDITDIWRQIVIDFPLTKNSTGTINTFGVVDNRNDSQHAALGMNYNDYLNGEFWARDWVKSGANPNTMKKDFPVLMMETSDFVAKEINPPIIKGCQQFYIAVEDLIECETCDEQRTANQVSCDVFDLLINSFLEFMTYGLYRVTTNGKDEYVWMPEEKYESILGDGINISETSVTIQTHLDYKKTTFKKWGKNYDKNRGASIAFSVCGCIKKKIDFNYTRNNEPDKYEGSTSCSCC